MVVYISSLDRSWLSIMLICLYLSWFWVISFVAKSMIMLMDTNLKTIQLMDEWIIRW